MKGFYDQSAIHVVKKFESDIYSGLKDSSVEKMRELYGKNIITKPKTKSMFITFFKEISQPWSLIMLLVCSLLLYSSRGIGIITSFIWGLNILIFTSFMYKEEKKLKAIETLNTSYVNVIRNGTTISVRAEELVVGDIVYIENKKYIPADIRLIECNDLKVKELAVTGESYIVEKFAAKISESVSEISQIKNMVFKSTVVAEGSGLGVVTSVGMDTQIGNIVKVLIEQNRGKNNLLFRLQQVINRITYVALPVAIGALFISIISGANLKGAIIASSSILITLVPIQFISAIIIFLVFFSKNLEKQGIHIKNLFSIELISKVSLILSDKKGIFSKNEMVPSKVYADNRLYSIIGGEEIKEVEYFNIQSKEDIEQEIDIKSNRSLLRLMQIGLLCNDSKYFIEDNEGVGDLYEIALIKFSLKNIMFKADVEKEFPRIFEVPYDSDKRIKTTINKVEDRFRANVQGAVDSILDKCTHIFKNGIEVEITPKDIENIKKAAYSMAKQSLNVFAYGYRNFNYEPSPDENIESNLVFTGLVGFLNPLKLNVYDSIKLMRLLGIRPIINMEENKIASSAIGREITLLKKNDSALSGIEMDFIDDDELERTTKNKNIYSKMKSKHKVRILNTLKNKDYLIGSIGKKLTDLPYLKISDLAIGFSDNCSGIIKKLCDVYVEKFNIIRFLNLIKESRQIIKAILNVLSYMIASLSGGVFLFLLGMIFNQQFILNLNQILWFNLFNSLIGVVILLIRYRDDKSSYIYNSSNREELSRALIKSIDINTYIIRGLVLGVTAYAGFIYGYINGHVTLGKVTAFAVLCIGQSLFTFNFSGGKILFNRIICNLLVIVNILIIGFMLSIPHILPILSSEKIIAKYWLAIGGISILNLILTILFKDKKARDRISI